MQSAGSGLRTIGVVGSLALVGLGAVACGSGGSGGSGGGKAVAIKLTDAGCSPDALKVDAGRTTFNVSNAGTSQVSEMEVLQGSRILGEKENLVAGLSGSFTLSLQPGSYTLSCPGGDSSATGTVEVGGKAVETSTDPLLQAAVAGYQRYVHARAVTLVKRVEPFVAAVQDGDVKTAKRLFAGARSPYETIEPVAESFGTLDPEVDARVNDVKAGDTWTGFHRIEKALWVDNTTKGMRPIAAKLLRDCQKLERKTRDLTYQPDELANGANGLLDEVASSKITGEEDRYSHTDLSDFEANVTGAQTTFGLLAPVLRKNEPSLAATISARFKAVQAELATLRKGASGYPSYATVNDAERKRLSELVSSLAKPVRQISKHLVQ